MTDTNQDSKTVEAGEPFFVPNDEFVRVLSDALTAQGYQHVGPDHVVVPRKALADARDRFSALRDTSTPYDIMTLLEGVDPAEVLDGLIAAAESKDNG